jgi:hypothetical protein
MEAHVHFDECANHSHQDISGILQVMSADPQYLIRQYLEPG